MNDKYTMYIQPAWQLNSYVSTNYACTGLVLNVLALMGWTDLVYCYKL